ncbi:aminotransferase class IV [Rufibacter radiotolerans]|uniref:aminotransferase class IV n=1 Tax=Rufibacter radiotolerans TaxID=1379910 RepID=UPI0006645A4F|nr:aminotransferase class IV [Rufibacter radiotolerans]
MFLLYNGEIIPEEDLCLTVSNRAFQYGDGFFETLLGSYGKVRFWADHLARMKEACETLRLELPEVFLSADFPDQLLNLGKQNECTSQVRFKLKVWRSGEGLYTPQTHQADWLVTAQPFSAPATTPLEVGICTSITTIPSPFSAFKGINAPVYVQASIEKQERALDDMLLLDPLGNVAELTYSNIFWVKEQTLFTPALATGCLNGIMRRNVIRWALKKNWPVKEGFFQFPVLTDADLVFSGNVTGLRALSSLEGEELSMDVELLEQLEQEFLSR